MSIHRDYRDRIDTGVPDEVTSVIREWAGTIATAAITTVILWAILALFFLG